MGRDGEGGINPVESNVEFAVKKVIKKVVCASFSSDNMIIVDGRMLTDKSKEELIRIILEKDKLVDELERENKELREKIKAEQRTKKCVQKSRITSQSWQILDGNREASLVHPAAQRHGCQVPEAGCYRPIYR